MARMNKSPQSVTGNPEKIVRGLTTVFQGFSIMFDGMAEQMQLMQDMTDQLTQPDTEQSSAKPDRKKNVPADAPKAEPPVDRSEETAETASADDTAETTDTESAEKDEDTPPWEEPQKQEDAEADAAPKEKPAVTITQADITKVIVSKIKLKRDNNAKIGKLLSAYGVSLLSDLPAEKYEAFLNDLSQL